MNIGSVGLGRWGTQLAATAVQSGSRIVDCFSPSEGSRQKFATQFSCASSSSLEALLGNPDVDAILVASPNSTHADIVCSSAEAGKHVLVEKPFALSVADAKKSILAAEKAGVTLQTGHSRRRVTAMRKFRGLVESETLGLVLQAEATTTRPAPKLAWFTGWRDDPSEAPLGGMTAIGVHMVDNLHYLLGPSASVFAVSRSRLEGQGLDDATVLVIEYESGAIAYLGTSLRVPATFSLKLMGSAAAAWTEDGRGQKAGASSRLFIQDLNDPAGTEIATEPVDPLKEQFDEFVRCCSSGDEPETGGAVGLAVVAVMEAAIGSVRARKAVSISDVI